MKAPFWDHASYIAYLRRNMGRNQDTFVLYDGEEGSGKSNAAMWDAIRLEESRNRRFDPGRGPIFTRDEWNERFDSGERERVYVLDEFENLAFSRNFQNIDQRQFIVLAQQARILRSTQLCCMPYLRFADKYFREGRFRIRVHVERLTDYDVACPQCERSHEVREATYYWRQRTEDMESGEVHVSWERIFVARHCPLALIRPEDWARYEANKFESVRNTSGSKRRIARKQAGTTDPKGALGAIRLLRRHQDELAAAGLGGIVALRERTPNPKKSISSGRKRGPSRSRAGATTGKAQE